MPPRWLRGLLAFTLTAAAVGVLAGCLSPKYKMARKDLPPAPKLDVSFPTLPPEAILNSVIAFGGPGSWKREAFWDEYVVTLRNLSEEPFNVVTAELADSGGVPHSPGDAPWTLERQSKDLERRYREAGMAFARAAAPRVMVATAEPVIATGAGLGSAGAAAAATTTAVALPVYGLAIWSVNNHNKTAITREFARRRLALPLTLAPGEMRTGSLFFPMIPDPRSLSLHWSNESDHGVSVLPLDFLHGFHVAATPASPSR